MNRRTSPMPPDAADVADPSPGAAPDDTRQPVRLGLWALAAGLAGFIAWAGLAPLDEGVVASGMVAIENRRHTIQHFSGGVVVDVKVGEGQPVKAQDVLLVLDDAGARANLEAVRQNHWALRAAESRLLAEQSGAPAIRFHPELQAAAAQDASVQRHLAVQQELFTARRGAQRSEMAALDEQVAALGAQLAGIRAVSAERRAQATAQATQLANVRALAEQGYAPRNQVLQLEQARLDLQAGLADLAAGEQRTLRATAEARQRQDQRRQEYRKEAATQLAEVRREVQAGDDKLRALRNELSRVEIRSPVDGQVVGLAVTATGGVVTPGQKLMDVVPAGRALLVDVRIPPQSIDRVRAGGTAEVRLHAFAHSPELVLPARVASVSADAVSEQAGGSVVSYYLARLKIEPEGLARLGTRVLQPGMPAEAVVVTGERSLLTYLLHPLLKRVAAAMKEE